MKIDFSTLVQLITIAGPMWLSRVDALDQQIFHQQLQQQAELEVAVHSSATAKLAVAVLHHRQNPDFPVSLSNSQTTSLPISPASHTS